jgi:hypothetical protein
MVIGVSMDGRAISGWFGAPTPVAATLDAVRHAVE